MGITLRRNIKGMLDFKLQPSIVLGIACHWSWIWIVFWSSSFYAVISDVGLQIEGSFLVEPLWFLSLLANALGLAVLFFIGQRAFSKRWPLFLWTAMALTLLGTFLVAQPLVYLPSSYQDALYCIGALITGFGSAVLFVLWGETLIALGMRQTVVYGTTATLAGALLFFITLLLPAPAIQFIAISLPVAEALFLHKQTNILDRFHAMQGACSEARSEDAGCEDGLTAKDDCSDPPRISPLPRFTACARKDIFGLVAISLFFGTSYGMMKGMFVFSGDELLALRDTINIVALILGAAAIFITMSVFEMDFNHLTYQVALPLMAAGFVCMALPDPFRLLGFFFHQFGYQYFYIILWALWSALSRNNSTVPAIRFCCASLTSVQSGQLVGSVIGSNVIHGASDQYTLAMISAIAVFVILIVALFGFGNSRARFGWGAIRPLVGPRIDSAPKFHRTCEKIIAVNGLSKREAEVFYLLAKGRNRSFISEQLVISESTAKTHIGRIYRKLGVHSQQALINMIEYERKSP